MNTLNSSVTQKEVKDEELMESFQEGNEQAFNLLIRRYKDRIHNFLFRYTHNHQDCEDLVQETFLRVFRSRHSYKRIARFSTWLYTIAINLAKTQHKKNQKMNTVSMHQEEDDENSREIVIEDDNLHPDESLHQRLCVSEVEKALEEIPEEFKEAVVLRDIQNLTYEEIMAITELPMGTVKSRINRGRLRLQEKLENVVYEETIV